MSVRWRCADRPWYRLTAHFFRGLFDFGVLSDAGSGAFQRVLIGIIAVMLTFGLLLARMFMGAASGRAAASLPQAPYRAAIEALLIALPMLIVAFAALLISHSLFPDETDFRVLLVLPVSRQVVFLSKLAALSLFTGIFVVAAHLAMLPLFLVMSIGGRSDQSFVVRFAAHAVASLSGSIFVVLALTGINGALMMWVPRRHLHAASMAARSALLCALVLSLPLAARLLTIAPLLAGGSPTLYLVPPAWFLAVEELLLGHASPYFWRLANIAGAAFVTASALAVGGYSWLYRRFDRVMTRPAVTTAGGRLGSVPLPGWAGPRGSNVAAISSFTHLTLARSGLPQGVFVAIAACGAGLVLNSFIGAHAIGRFQTYEQALASSAIWAPFALMFATTLAVRTALVLPIEPRANWVFRMTEHDTARVDQVEAVVRSMIHLGVVLPLLILFPVQWATIHGQAIASTAVTLAAGIALVEIEMSEWRRIPFTCSYMPGKRFVGLTLIVGFSSFVPSRRSDRASRTPAGRIRSARWSCWPSLARSAGNGAGGARG